MSVIYQFRRLVFAQVLLGIVAFCMAARNPTMLLVAGSIGALAWYVTEGPSGRPLPRWLTNLGALGVAVWVCMSVTRQPASLIILMGYFIMWLQVVLLYTNKTNREYGQLLMLSVLQITAASTLSMSMLYGLTMGLYCVVALVTILLFQFKMTSDEVLATYHKAAPDKEQALTRPMPVVGRGHRWQFRLHTLLLAGVCFAVAALLFVLIPRSGEPFAGAPLDHDLPVSRSAGFSERVRLDGSIGVSSNDQQPMLHLSVRGGPVSVRSADSWLVRGAVMDTYSPRQRTWSRSESLPMLSHVAELPTEGGRALAALSSGASFIEGEIELRQSSGNVVFTLERPAVWMASADLRTLEINPLDFQVQTPSGTAGARYTVRSLLTPVPDLALRYRQALGPPPNVGYDSSYRPRTQASRRALLAGPSNYARGWNVEADRLRAYTLQVLEQQGLTRDPDAEHTPHDLAIAQALAEHLRTHATYALTNPELEEGQDPIIEFLFTHREGHCELFASALAAMTRSIGIPARLVTGYRASEYNTVGGYYVVRRRNAHAWTEVHAGPSLGWIPIDATPPAAVDAVQSVDRNWLSAVRDFYEHVEYTWLGSFMAFDQQQRTVLIEGVETSISEAAQDETRWLGRGIAFIQSLRQLGQLDAIGYTTIAVTFVALLVALGSLVHLMIVRRRRMAALQLTALPRARRRGLARRLRFYLVMLDMLERRGYIRPAWQSPFSFAEELADANPLRFDPVIALTELFYEIRFGYRELDDDRRHRIKAHLKQLEHALARS